MPASQGQPFSKEPIPGYGFYLLTGTVIVLCLQVIIYLLLIGNTLGPVAFFRRQPPPDPSLVRQLRVGLVRSEATARLFPQDPQVYFLHAAHWEQVFRREGIPYRIISDAQLTQGAGDADVLVLPAVNCLGAPQRKTILKFLEDGKGVVASGSLGTRDGNCVWTGWDFLANLSGIERLSVLAPPAAINVTFRGETFFSQDVPTGYRLEIPSQEITVGNSEEPDAYWSDWMLRPAGGHKLQEVALASHGTRATGRLVWFGFSELLPAARVIDQGLLDHYLTSSVRWVGKQPLATLANWPADHRAAVLIAEEVQPDPASSEASVGLLKQEKVPATFFCVQKEAEKNPGAIKGFESVGEVASLGDTLEPFAGQLPVHQAERLRSAKEGLEKFVREEVVGFSAPEGLADTATIVALKDAGYEYYLNDLGVTRAVPDIVEFVRSVFFPFQKTEVLKLFRTASDDFEVIAAYRGPPPPSLDLAEGFLSDFRRILYLGGVYTLYFRSYLLGSPQYHDVLRAVLEQIKSQPVWIAKGAELAHWWSARAKVEVQARRISVHRIGLDIANKGEDRVDQASVYLYLPYRPRQIKMSAVVFRLRPPHYQMLDHDNILRVDFPRLSAQTNYSYIVHLDE